jgi:hypothetical protein
MHIAQEFLQGLFALRAALQQHDHARRWERIGNHTAVVLWPCQRVHGATQKNSARFINAASGAGLR